ncbi:glycosyltransferase family 2 protein [Vibrio sp. McD22-P3]|uniref:glycosyltransferase family 2 protein n=1 Tax=Vibrio sp. McD22-P3 TaxID=2724880 RepID=UPI001F4400B0|nr:glycosyltransferase family 2 protein [Vibrio sp. McD22-P3]MCF4175271.1 glycosyltransferase family 2 protein [Vibrio sp. McD22-P3]
MDKIVLFVPCYNCEKQITRVIKQLETNNHFEYFYEIMIIDNGSSDGTIDSAINMVRASKINNIRVVKNSQNVGLGGTHKLAFRHAIKINASHIAVLHGDDQGQINDLVNILENQEHNEYDCCLGSRFDPQSKLAGYSKFRIFGNYVFNVIFSVAAGKKITDLGSGLNIYKVSAINDKKIEMFSNDLTFNCYMVLYSINKNHSMKFFPITWREDDQISNVKLFSQAKKTLKIAKEYFFRKEKGLVCKNNVIDFDSIYFIEKYSGEKYD